MKNVKMTLRSTYLLEDARCEVFTYDARLDTKGGSDYLMYEETEPAVKTIIKAGVDEAVISRSGETKSTLKIKKGGKHDTVYSTPYGPFCMTVRGIRVENRLNDGYLLLEYKLENNGVIAHNRIEITLKEV